MMKLDCIIVDDEPLALSMLENYVRNTPFLHLRQQFTSAVLALQWLEQNTVELVFLDIQMPDVTGLEIAKKISQNCTSKDMRFIFATAYSHYALEGYKVQAIDYLLKPFNFSDFTVAVDKAVEFFSMVRHDNLPSKIEPEFIFIKVGYELVKISVEEILFLEGAKDYVKVYLEKQQQPLMAYSTLKGLSEKLPNDKFLQVHRSFVISKSKVFARTKNTVTIANSTIPVTANYREHFLNFMKDWC